MTKQEDKVSINPISGWEFKTVPSMDVLIFSVSYLSSPMQTPEEAQKSPTYALTSSQARDLIKLLERGLGELEKNGSQGDGHPKH